jgi:3-methyladenine DNA glycosylase AlkC
MSSLLPRKGARRIADIPPDIRQAINSGQLATVNLIEFLAADLSLLTPAVAQQIGLDPQHPALIAAVNRLFSLKPMQRHREVARALRDAGCNEPDISERLATHPSDLARQWAAMQIGLDSTLTLAARLEQVRRFAADPHFGVREIAWLAVRDAVAADLEMALELLHPWVLDADPNLRRFASEVTRPRGVWCVHLDALKINPEPGLQLLEALRADPSRYVQNSVANWLNDAAKSRPDWVIERCARWQMESPEKSTDYICRRGLRTLQKANSSSKIVTNK